MSDRGLHVRRILDDQIEFACPAFLTGVAEPSIGPGRNRSSWRDSSGPA